MQESKDSLGIIAGGGQFPIMVAEAAKKRGLHVFAVAHYGETEPALSQKVDEIIWIKLGQLGHMIKAFKKSGVSKTLMAGSIAKRRMFDNIRPDVKGLTVMSKLAIFHDDDILRAVAAELAKEGIEIVPSTLYLPELLAPPGCLTKRKPGKSEKAEQRILNHQDTKNAKGNLELRVWCRNRRQSPLGAEVNSPVCNPGNEINPPKYKPCKGDS